MKTLRELRKEHRLTLADVGRLIGVSAQAVQYWEVGTDTPNVQRLRQLAAVYGICSDLIRLPKLNGKDEPR